MNTIPEVRVSVGYRIDHQIGKGLFGEVYSGKNVHSGELIAIKLESKQSKYPQVLFEAQILKELKECPLIPSPLWSGASGDYNCLVMKKLGDNLETLQEKGGGMFSLKTVLMLADQMLQTLEFIHCNNVIHRDIKPSNFCMGYEGEDFCKLFLIDFGLSKILKTAETGHIPLVNGKSMLGSPKFCSYHSHNGMELSRRDDLISMIYVLIYFLTGSLPWLQQDYDKNDPSHNKTYHNIKKDFINSEYWVQALAFKDETKSEQVGVPQQLWQVYQHITDLDFYEEPDYTMYRKNLKRIFLENGLQFDKVYDWIASPNHQEEEELMRDIRDLLDEDPIFDEQEFEELEDIMNHYENEGTILNFGLKEVKKENRKYEIMPEDDSEILDEQESEIQAVKNIAHASITARNPKKKDCQLI